MAVLTKTINNSVNVFGPAPSNKWNAFNWNAFTWGEGTATLEKRAFKVLSESVTLTDAFTKSASLVISNTLSPVSSIGQETLRDESGYERILPGGVTDGVDRVSSTWSAGSAGSTTWVASSTTATTWSDA